MQLETLLEYYNIPIENEVRNKPDEVMCFCPFHTGDSGEPRMMCNLVDNIYHCWSCNAGGNYLDFIIAMEPNISDRVQAALFFKSITTGNYDIDSLKERWERKQQKMVEFVPNNYKQEYTYTISLIYEKILSLYILFPSWYFVLRKGAYIISLRTGDTDVFFNFLDPNIENTIQLIDYRVSRLEDNLLPSCYNNIDRLRSFYQYFLVEYYRLHHIITNNIGYLIP